MEAVKFAKGDPSRKRGKEELEEMIRATQLYILSYIMSQTRWKPKLILKFYR